MAAKLVFAAALLGLASASFLGNSPKKMLAQKSQRMDKIDMSKVNETSTKDTMAQSMVASLMNTLKLWEKEGLAPDQLDAMSTTIEGLVTQSDDPATKIAVKSMSNFIVHTMIPNRLKSQAMEQKRLDKQMKDLKNCHLDNQVHLDMNVYQDVQNAKAHKQAKIDNTAKHGECLNVLEGKELVTSAYCNAIDEEKVCACHPLMVENFRSTVNCKIAPEIDPVNKKCCDSYAEHRKHDLDCQNAKLNAEFADKQHTIIMGKVCSKYELCYNQHLKTFKEAEEFSKKTEATRSWPVLYRVKCLVGKFDHGKVSKEEAQACKDETHDVKGVEYPEVPAKDPECENV